ncbi:tetratricopeptide repeat protein [Lichenifustis flavocetrariae]|uniref:Tetratricopeptide repeat protein n=1 Tax=Lichenifustis flavocetrariae TaxID=2949735 RepID=A0AA41YXM9_9HYPH|nr:tetratricopeptide repeat-containing sulfotransferase family protein [Lichenifustis flavocetrariae]MCW6509146.1 tetratricopeptide repeat protein [Lichenifustis flavocetrariae]
MRSREAEIGHRLGALSSGRNAMRPKLKGASSRTFQRAVASHQARRLSDAEALYGQVLLEDPVHFDSRYLLGAVLMEQGRYEAALTQLDACLELRPGDAAALRVSGLVRSKLGQSHAALHAFEQALAARPDWAELHNDHGNTLAILGRVDEALEAFGRAILRNAIFAEAHNNRGNLLTGLKRFEEALGAFDAAIACQPGLAAAHNNRGNVLKAMRRTGAALASYDQALAISPTYVSALNNRGNALRDLGHLDRALASYDAALTLQPDYVDGHINRADVLIDVARFDEALAACDAALAASPGYAEAHNMRGNVLKHLKRLPEALAAYDEALALKPTYADAHANRGLLLTEIGRTAEGCVALETALVLEPGTAGFFYSLTQCKRMRQGDPLIGEMEARATHDTSLSTRERIDLHFGLGKAHADIGDPAAAFKHLLAGNRRQRTQIRYDEVSTLNALARMRAAFTPTSLKVGSERGNGDRRPIFILGMPRSGSTLVEQILAGHPDVFAAGEIDDLRLSIRSLGPKGDRLLEAAEPLTSLSPEDWQQVGADYLARLDAVAPNAKRVSNKTPDNFRLVGLIRLMLPDARIIHTRRDPVDTCLSCFATRFTGHQPFTYDLGELGRYYAAYRATMNHWRAILPADVMLDIDYEDVVDDLEGQSRRLLAHCGLEWTDRCLDFQHAIRPVLTASASQVRQPLYRQSVGRWHAYEAYLQPLLAELSREAV